MNTFEETVRSDDDGIARRYEYDDTTVLIADIGPVDATVDIVDETAIVVAGDDQYEFALPETPARASMNNGVLTIEVNR